MGIFDIFKTVTKERITDTETSKLTSFNGDTWRLELGPAPFDVFVTHKEIAESGMTFFQYLTKVAGVSPKYLEDPSRLLDANGSRIGVGVKMTFLNWLRPDAWVWYMYKLNEETGQWEEFGVIPNMDREAAEAHAAKSIKRGKPTWPA